LERSQFSTVQLTNRTSVRCKRDRSDCWHCCCVRFIYTKKTDE